MARKTACKVASLRTYRVVRFFLFCSILETVYKIVQAVDGHSQAYIRPEERDLHYVMDRISLKTVQNSLSSDDSSVSFTELEDESLQTFASPIIFEPSALDFGIHPVGMPQMERVYVQNPSVDASLRLLSISGSTVHFHCSFFQEKVIAPGGNTSFDIVFLARQEGHIENTLFIHTSLGSFKYQVLAIGTANPYRLQPFLGVRMPLNSSYSPLIHMHNPHSSTLQVTEMYTSGGDLHLELPMGESEASVAYWTIPPYETRTVMRANFVARVERNHTTYIRIKTNATPTDYLVIPVEVEVSAASGIYAPLSVLDFGVLRSQDKPKTLSLGLLNAGQKYIHIVNTIVAPVNEAIEIKFSPLRIPPDTLHSTEVANITFYPSRASSQKQCSGKIVVKTKNNQFKLTVPYQVTLLQGSLGYGKNVTRFYVGHDPRSNVTHVRQFSLVNHFNETLVIHAASLPTEARSYFSLNFTLPVLLPPSHSAVLGWLIFNPPSSNPQTTTHLRLLTNVSYFEIPLICFSGKLQLFFPQGRNQSFLDFGTVGVEEKHSLIFAVVNENPVDVRLRHWGSNTGKAYVELLGLNKGNISTLARRRTFSDLSKSLTLKPQHYAIFRVGVTASSQEGVYVGESFLETQYEVVRIPYSLRTAKGNLVADDLFFDNAFPGKISSRPLYVKSTFSHPMTVTSVVPVPEDLRFTFEPSKVATDLQHGLRNLVGKVLFDPRVDCKQKCYSGLPTTSSMGHRWLLGMVLPSDVGEVDAQLYASLRERWRDVVSSGEKNTNVTFRLDTSEIQGFFLRAQATLHWPRLSSKCHLRFPITQINNLTVKDFAIENPSSLPVLVQVVPLHLYPNPQSIIRTLAHKLGGETAALKHLHDLDSHPFTLQDLEQFNLRTDNPIPAYRRSLEEYFGVATNKQTIAMLLTPGMRVRVRVGFLPEDDLPRTSLVLIRNNLTVVDALVVQGQGGRGQIRFGNKDPGTDSTLMFELSDKHLKDCKDAGSGRFSQPNFTVRRAFTARNTGELPVYVSGFDINGSPCEGYGFRVLHCSGFELKPNASRKVDIAFTPDFTLSRVERLLNVHTSLGYALPYILVATLPRHLLSSCGQSLPRPGWETLLYYSVVCLLLFLLLCVLMAAVLEGDRILKTGFFPLATTEGVSFDPAVERGQLFDLKTISKSSLDSRTRYMSTSEKRKDYDYSSGPTNICSKDVGLPCSDWDPFGQSMKVIARSKVFNGKSESESPNTEKVAGPRMSNKTWSETILQSLSFARLKSSASRDKLTNAATQTIKESKADCESRPLQKSGAVVHPRIQSVAPSRGKNKQPTKNLYVQTRSKKSSDSNGYWEEETSSTTTESSNPESDISEKEQRLPDVCIPAQAAKQKTSKGVSASEKVVGVEKDVEADDKDFELSTKSKAHKKIKVAKSFGADILQPSTLELPYKPQPVAPSGCKNRSSVSKLSCKSSVRMRIGKTKEPVDAADSFSDLSPPTENFALRLGLGTMPCSKPRNLSRDGLSYSSIVSGDGQWKSCSPTGTTNFHESAVPFIASPGRPKSLPLTSDLGSGSNVKWTPTKCFDGDILLPTRRLQCPENEDDGDVFPNSWGTRSVSFMQDLQAKRRQRLDEYYKQNSLSSWPGFDSPLPQQHSLWDSKCISTGSSWTTTHQPNKESSASDAFWSPSSTSTWPAFTPSNPGREDPLDLLSSLPVAQEGSMDHRTESREMDFGPFNHLSSIWSPNPDTVSTGWNFSLFTDNILNTDKKDK